MTKQEDKTSDWVGRKLQKGRGKGMACSNDPNTKINLGLWESNKCHYNMSGAR